MRISDWSSDVCSSDLATIACARIFQTRRPVFPINPVFTASAPTAQTSSVFCVRSKPSRVRRKFNLAFCAGLNEPLFQPAFIPHITASCLRSEEHTSELQSLMRISYAVFCLKTKKKHIIQHYV